MKKVSSFTLLFITIAVVALGVYLAGRPMDNSQVSSIKIDKSDGYKLLVNNEPLVIRGVCYSPIPVGKDYEYNFWGDPNKPWLYDGKMMKAMGVNTVRLYRVGKNPEEVRQVVSDLYSQFGIYSLMGHYLGFWSWPPPNYADDAFKEKVKTEVLEMVRLYKDTPGVLMWVLGNENNYSFDRDVQRWSSDAIDALPTPEEQKKEKARLYYSFVNDLAREIKQIDPRHPVVMGVGEVASLDSARQHAPDVDVIGVIAYRGNTFGSLFRQVKQKYDLPVLVTEWGADSYNALRGEPDEESQAEFLKEQWKDIERNTYLKNGEKNALGGTLFEWNDEWWKGNENLPDTWSIQDTAGHWGHASYYHDAEVLGRMNMNEEWWGVVALNPKNTVNGNHERVPKKSYLVLKSLWNQKR